MYRLFSECTIFDVLQSQKKHIKDKVDALVPNYLLKVSDEDLVRSLTDELSLQVPELGDPHSSEPSEIEIDVSGDPNRAFLDDGPFYIKGTQITITIPFDGDGRFFNVQPQTFSWPINFPEVRLNEDAIRLIFAKTDHNSGALKREYESAIQAIKTSLSNLKTSVKSHNESIEAHVRSLIAERKQKLLADAGMVAALGIPIKRRHDATTTYAVPVTKRRPKIERPIAKSDAFMPEPTLSDEDYKQILSIVGSMVHVMERSPKAFENMGEEDLRTHFLVQLNGQYEGQATGETFNFQGKTDILIRVEDRNIFVDECKFWKGEKTLLETIDQLLSYLSWRDTKAAILLFNRNASFSDVLAKVAEFIPIHKCYKRDLGKSGETVFRYVFHQPEDTNRELLLTVLAFDIPTRKP